MLSEVKPAATPKAVMVARPRYIRLTVARRLLVSCRPIVCGRMRRRSPCYGRGVIAPNPGRKDGSELRSHPR